MHVDDKSQAGPMFGCSTLVWDGDVINELFRNVGGCLKRGRRKERRKARSLKNVKRVG